VVLLLLLQFRLHFVCSACVHAVLCLQCVCFRFAAVRPVITAQYSGSVRTPHSASSTCININMQLGC
jgi:hypothetical protein